MKEKKYNMHKELKKQRIEQNQIEMKGKKNTSSLSTFFAA